MSPEEANSKAADAKRLLNDPLLRESFDNAETALNKAVRLAKTPEEAFKSAIACQVFELIRGQIEAHVETAKVIEFNFQNRQSLLNRLTRR